MHRPVARGRTRSAQHAQKGALQPQGVAKIVGWIEFNGVGAQARGRVPREGRETELHHGVAVVRFKFWPLTENQCRLA